jgi:transcriptional regulator with PAS, ATPase and Fis domain
MLIQNNKISFVNNAFVNLFGCISAKKLIDLNPISLFNNEFENIFVKITDIKWHEHNQKNLPKRFGFFHKGDKRWIATKIKDINLISRADTIIIFKDITEEMLREIAIQEEAEQIRQENVKLRASIKERFRFGNIIGKSSVMQHVYELALKAASTDANVSILGESGTGKELLAKAIHDMSNCTEKAFVPVNCGAIPENLAESEFFGHVKGAFTGAHINKNGYLHTVNQGTLFLDEVGELSLKMQAKLLRALDSGEYTPVGSTRYQKSKFRIISATNRDISEMVNQGLMREDFYYRLNVIPITLPPLRERKEDILLLIEHFLTQYGNGKARTLCGKTIDILCSYHWPGNVRELQNIIQRYLTVGKIEILKMNNNDSGLTNGISKDTDLKNAVIDFEKQYILRALNQNEWNRCQTAATLNINVRTLYEKMKKCGLRSHASD